MGLSLKGARFAAWGFVFLGLVSCVDTVEIEPWELAEPDNESLCPELVGWQADDEFRRLPENGNVSGVERYERRFPLGYEGCGVYATKTTLTLSNDRQPSTLLDVQICNRCERDVQLLWIGDPLRYESSQNIIEWAGREATGTDLKIDLGTSEETNYRINGLSYYALGPVTFISDVSTGESLIDSCVSEMFEVPPALVKVVVKGKDMLSYRAWLHSGFVGNHICQMSGRERPERLESSLSHGDMTFSWPRLQEMNVAFDWENAAYLPGAACEERGIRQQMCITYTDHNWPHPFIEAERPITLHQENHFTQDVGVIEFPVPLGEIFYAD